MIRSRQLLLLAILVALQAEALPSQARGESCRSIAVAAADQSLVLVNSSPRPKSLALRFEPIGQAPLACGSVSIAAGSDSGVTTLAALCPGVAPQPGILEACTLAPRPHTASTTGELGADLLANNLPVAGN